MPRPPGLAILSLFVLGACDPCPVPDDLPPGTVEAEVDGRPWETASGRFLLSEAGLQGVTDLEDGWMITMVLQRTFDDRSVIDALDAPPLEVPLTTGESGGFAILRDDESGTLSTAEGQAGSALVVKAGDDEVLGCFSFLALGDEREVRVDAGRFRLSTQD